ncbi:MAG: penicillin-binding protein 2 [Nocardioides sp.]
MIAVILSVYAGRLVQLQVLDPQSLATMAAEEGRVEVPLVARRGEITDRFGEPLATSIDGLAISVDPAQTAALAPELATLFAQRLGADYFTVLRRLRGDGHFAYVARRVPATLAVDVVAEAKAMGCAGEDEVTAACTTKGIFTEVDPVRDYPAHDVGANMVGLMGQDAPLTGMEVSFNKWLAGTDGRDEFMVAGGNRLPLGESSHTDPVNGRPLELTIDRDLQWYASRLLRKQVTATGSLAGTATVLDTQTGEVLAFVDYPTFDPAAPDQSRQSDRASRGLSNVYEPGSVQKVLTAAALLNERVVTPRTPIRVPGTLTRGGRVLHDWFEHGPLRLTMTGVLSKSSNIGTVLAADRMSALTLRKYLVNFGFGQRTEVGANHETAGLLPSPGNWTPLTKDRIAFGQSVSVNALQMAAAINAVANGGVYVPPSLVRGRATTNEGTEVGTETVKARRVVSAKAARQTAAMMERVLDPIAGTAPGAAVPGYRVAGKTGTAQRAVHQSYVGGGTVVSFAGFAPADKPRFTVYVVLTRPRVAGGGGSLAGPVFAQLMAHVLMRYGVEPTGTPPSRLPAQW